MKNVLLSICFFIVFTINAVGQSNPQVMMQGWYWDYPKTANNFSWADTLRLKAQTLSTAGITHMWFPPHTVASFGTNSNGYDPKDLFIGNQTTGLGTRPNLDAMLNSFTAVGIKAVADMIYNHRDGGRPETNAPVKNYVKTYNAGGGSNPFPSDRMRLALPINTTASGGNGYTSYFVKVSSKTGNSRFVGSVYQALFWTNKTGRNPVSVTPVVGNYGGGDCGGQPFWITNLNQPVSSSVILGSACNTTEFRITLDNTNCNSVDTLFFTLINNNNFYGDQFVDKIWNPARSINVESDLLYQTYTDFTNLTSTPSGTITIGGSAVNVNGNFEDFKPNTTNPGGGGLTGDQDGMLFFYDYDQNQTSTQNLLNNWTHWNLETLGVRGLRMDAVKHFPTNFVSQLLNSMATRPDKPDLIVGEWFDSGNPAVIKGWIDGVTGGLTSAANSAFKVRAFDFPLRQALRDACNDNNFWARNILFNGLAQNGVDRFNVVTFLNNHDFRGPTDNGPLAGNQNLAYAYLLTNNQIGLPTIFYPDYYGYPAPDATQATYFPANRTGYQTELNRLMKIQKTFIAGSTAISYLNHYGGINNGPGTNAHIINGDINKSLVYQLSGTGSAGGKEVIVAINFGTSPLQIDHRIDTRGGTIPDGTRFGDVLGRSALAASFIGTSGGNGAVTNSIYIDLPAKSYSVWVQDAVPLSVTLVSSTVCAGRSNTLTASITGGNGPFTYSFSAGATAIPGSTSLASVTAAGPYSVTVTDDFGVSVTATMSSTFLTTPIINSLTTNATAQPFCTQGTNRTTLTLSATVTNGSTYTVLAGGNGGTIAGSTWTGNSTTGVISGGGSFSVNRTTDVTNKAGSYTLIVANAAGTCSATMVSAPITVSASPTATLSNSLSGLAASTTLCSANQPVTLSATALGGLAPYGSYLFETSPLASGAGFVSFSSTASNTISSSIVSSFTNGTAVQRYRVTVMDNNGCVSAASTGSVAYIQTIVTLQTPSAPTVTNTPAQLTACVGSPLTLTASCSTGSIVWNDNSTSTTLAIASVATGTTVYSATCVSMGCSSSATSVTVTGYNLPTATLLPNPATLTCAQPSLTLTASGGSTYNFSTGQSGSSNTVVVTSAGTYSVLVTDANGCAASATASVTSETNVPSISLPSVNTATVGVSLPVGLLFEVSGGQSPYTITVNTLPPGLSVNSTATQRTISGIPTQAGVFPVSVTATGANGCSAVSGAYSLTVDCPMLSVGAANR